MWARRNTSVTNFLFIYFLEVVWPFWAPVEAVKARQVQLELFVKWRLKKIHIDGEQNHHGESLSCCCFVLFFLAMRWFFSPSLQLPKYKKQEVSHARFTLDAQHQLSCKSHQMSTFPRRLQALLQELFFCFCHYGQVKNLKLWSHVSDEKSGWILTALSISVPQTLPATWAAKASSLLILTPWEKEGSGGGGGGWQTETKAAQQPNQNK